MYVGIARYDFLVPASTSLKDKRRVVKSLLGGVQVKFKVSAAEVEHLELRQRGAIGVSCVSGSSFHARRVLQEVERFFRGQYEIEVLSVDVEVVNSESA